MKNNASDLNNRLQSTEDNSLSNWTNKDITELMLGMIVNALEEIRDGRKSKSMQQEAIEWFLSDDYHSPFSFVNCCSVIGLDAQRLRFYMNILTNGDLKL